MKKNAYIFLGGIGFMFLFVIAWFILKFTAGSKIPFLDHLLLIIAGLFIFMVFRFLRVSVSRTRNLKKTGVPAKAKIVGITNEPYRPGKIRQVSLSLEMTNQFGQTYVVKCIVYGSEDDPGEFYEGKIVDVLKDPANENNVLLEYERKGMKSTAVSYNIT